MIRSPAVALVLTALLTSCNRAAMERARADSVAADSAARAEAADSKARMDSIAAALAKESGAQSKTKGQDTTRLRDFADPNPKLKQLPVVADTAKRRPPP